MRNPDTVHVPERRHWLKHLGTAALGAFLILPALAGGLLMALDPLRRRRPARGGFVRVTSLSALPADGVPRRFPVFADATDAWTRSPRVRIGAVYLRRTAEQRIEALNVVCPHAGCFVNYSAAQQRFNCPCHNSHFGLDGAITDPHSPSPRPLDALEVELRDKTEVWVRFQNFRAGVHQKIPVA
jgi:menaquinol-cytochrome c reductase iron-sulfur subunit